MREEQQAWHQKRTLPARMDPGLALTTYVRLSAFTESVTRLLRVWVIGRPNQSGPDATFLKACTTACQLLSAETNKNDLVNPHLQPAISHSLIAQSILNQMEACLHELLYTQSLDHALGMLVSLLLKSRALKKRTNVTPYDNSARKIKLMQISIRKPGAERLMLWLGNGVRSVAHPAQPMPVKFEHDIKYRLFGTSQASKQHIDNQADSWVKAPEEGPSWQLLPSFQLIDSSQVPLFSGVLVNLVVLACAMHDWQDACRPDRLALISKYAFWLTWIDRHGLESQVS